MNVIHLCLENLRLKSFFNPVMPGSKKDGSRIGILKLNNYASGADTAFQGVASKMRLTKYIRSGSFSDHGDPTAGILIKGLGCSIYDQWLLKSRSAVHIFFVRISVEAHLWHDYLK